MTTRTYTAKYDRRPMIDRKYACDRCNSPNAHVTWAEKERCEALMPAVPAWADTGE